MLLHILLPGKGVISPASRGQHSSPGGCSLAKSQRDPAEGLRCLNPFWGACCELMRGISPSLVSCRGCTGLCCHPSQGGGAVRAWLVFGLSSFLSLIFRVQGGDSPPSPRTWKAGLSPPLQPGWACCQCGARGCYQGWAGPGSQSLSPPPEHPDYGGPLACRVLQR